VALVPPILLVLMGLATKWFFTYGIRKEVIAPAIKALEPSQLHSLYNNTKFLCVGCTSGIGLRAAIAACEGGAFVVVVGRKRPDALLDVCMAPVEFMKADLSIMHNVPTVTQRLAPYEFDTVLFTVGIVTTPERKVSVEGIEMDTAVSFLSRFYMARLLAQSKTLKATPTRKPRVFVMGFPGHEGAPQLDDFNWENKTNWQPWAAHMNGVIGNDALVQKLAAFHPSMNVYGLNPGILKTDIVADFLGGKKGWKSKAQQWVVEKLCPSAEEYVNSTLRHLLVSPELEDLSGSYFNQFGERIKGAVWLRTEGHTDKILAAAGKLVNRAMSHEKAILSNVMLYSYIKGRMHGDVELVSNH
jgi:NAD(P)-dependent dehydrogenase (short-subunit alcohol dehydrogenase family)